MTKTAKHAVKNAIYLPAEGDGDVIYHDGAAFSFRTRIDSNGFRRIRLLHTEFDTPVTSPEREASLREWLDSHHPHSAEGDGQ